MKSWAAAIRAARSTCACVALGCPNAMLAATVLEKRKASWKTVPMLRRRSSRCRAAHVDPVDQNPAPRHVVRPWDEAHQDAFPRAGAPRIATHSPGFTSRSMSARPDPGGHTRTTTPSKRTAPSRRGRRTASGPCARRSGRQGSQHPAGADERTAGSSSRSSPRCSPGRRTGPGAPEHDQARAERQPALPTSHPP